MPRHAGRPRRTRHQALLSYGRFLSIILRYLTGISRGALATAFVSIHRVIMQMTRRLTQCSGSMETHSSPEAAHLRERACLVFLDKHVSGALLLLDVTLDVMPQPGARHDLCSGLLHERICQETQAISLLQHAVHRAQPPHTAKLQQLLNVPLSTASC